MPYMRDYDPGWSVANRPKLDLSFSDAFAAQMLGMMRDRAREAQRQAERKEERGWRKEDIESQRQFSEEQFQSHLQATSAEALKRAAANREAAARFEYEQKEEAARDAVRAGLTRLRNIDPEAYEQFGKDFPKLGVLTRYGAALPHLEKALESGLANIKAEADAAAKEAVLQAKLDTIYDSPYPREEQDRMAFKLVTGQEAPKPEVEKPTTRLDVARYMNLADAEIQTALEIENKFLTQDEKGKIGIMKPELWGDQVEFVGAIWPRVRAAQANDPELAKAIVERAQMYLDDKSLIQKPYEELSGQQSTTGTQPGTTTTTTQPPTPIEVTAEQKAEIEQARAAGKVILFDVNTQELVTVDADKADAAVATGKYGRIQ